MISFYISIIYLFFYLVGSIVHNQQVSQSEWMEKVIIVQNSSMKPPSQHVGSTHLWIKYAVRGFHGATPWDTSSYVRHMHISSINLVQYNQTYISWERPHNSTRKHNSVEGHQLINLISTPKMRNCKHYIISNNVASNITLLWYRACSKVIWKHKKITWV